MAETERSGEPITEAGRRLLAQENIGDGTGWVELPYDEIRDAILAIEAEVRATPPDTDPTRVAEEMFGWSGPPDTDPRGLGDVEAAWAAIRVEHWQRGWDAATSYGSSDSAAIQESRAGGGLAIDVERLKRAHQSLFVDTGQGMFGGYVEALAAAYEKGTGS